MQIDYIIVGQGLAGSLLAYELHKTRKKILLVDEDKSSTSSKIAAGIMLPITGRRLVKTWKADLLIPFAKRLYQDMEKTLGEKFFHELPVLEIFNSVKNRNDWIGRSIDPEYMHYVGAEIHADFMKHVLKAVHGGILINNSGFLDICKLIDVLKKYFVERKMFLSGYISPDDLIIKDDGVKWKNISASKILFCDGSTASRNPFFMHLPFLPSKGEILKIFSAGLPQDYIINNSMYILPLGNNLFKAGSTFQWNFKDDKPTDNGRRQIETFLNNFLKKKFEIISHEAAVRPTVQDRRPYIGLHSVYPAIGIFNGLGTKGVMLAPYFANQFVNFLSGKGELDKQVDVRRCF